MHSHILKQGIFLKNCAKFEPTIIIYNCHNSAPSVCNLSLEDNNIGDVAQLDHLTKLPLRELVLRDNPIALDVVAYRAAIKRRFPSLKYLDTQEIKPLIEFNVVSCCCWLLVEDI
jgi:hypothetical protein